MEQAARADGLLRLPTTIDIKVNLDPAAQSWFPYGYPTSTTVTTFTYNSSILSIEGAFEAVAEALFGWLT